MKSLRTTLLAIAILTSYCCGDEISSIAEVSAPPPHKSDSHLQLSLRMGGTERTDRFFTFTGETRSQRSLGLEASWENESTFIQVESSYQQEAQSLSGPVDFSAERKCVTLEGSAGLHRRWQPFEFLKLKFAAGVGYDMNYLDGDSLSQYALDSNHNYIAGTAQTTHQSDVIHGMHLLLGGRSSFWEVVSIGFELRKPLVTLGGGAGALWATSSRTVAGIYAKPMPEELPNVEVGAEYSEITVRGAAADPLKTEVYQLSLALTFD